MKNQNYYLKHAKAIRSICRKEKVDVGVAVAMFEEKAGHRDYEERREFIKWCNTYTLNKIIETDGACIEPEQEE